MGVIFFVIDYKVDRIFFNKYKYIRLESFFWFKWKCSSRLKGKSFFIGRRGCWGAVEWCGGVVG